MPATCAAVEDLLRRARSDLARAGAADWRDAGTPAGMLDLLERFGVPADVDLGGIAARARRCSREMRDATIPLPHPYDLELSVLRIERLRDRQ